MDSAAATILIVEDDRPTRTFLADNLAADGFEVIEARDGASAWRALRDESLDLAILDLTLPDRDGLDLLSEIRATDRLATPDPELPLLVLSGRAGELHRLRGFDRGADDYLPKPFSYRELHARIRALLRRTRREPSRARVRVGGLELDPVSRQVWVDGRLVGLSNKEFSLLRALAAEPTRAFTREELLRDVWGFRSLGTTRTLDSHASRVRAKLRTHGLECVINVWGIGYRLTDGPPARAPGGAG